MEAAVDFQVAFVLDLGNGDQGIVVTAYHDVNKRQAPKPSRLARYCEIMDRSGAFGAGAIDAVNGTELIHIWLDHLLVHSMLQHPSGRWRWGRLVVVYPCRQLGLRRGVARYGSLLVVDSTFTSVTLEERLDSDVLPATASLRDRYLPRQA